MNWSEEKIKKIAAADDLHVSPFREDGKTYGTPTWIWSVVVDGELYARAYNGQNSRWHKAAREQGAGRISIAGLRKRDVRGDRRCCSQRPCRCRLPLQILQEPIPCADDRCTRACRYGQGIALAPDFADSRKAFLYYSYDGAAGPANRVIAVTFDGDA